MPQELGLRVDPHHLGVQLADEHIHHHVALVQAQQTVVDKNAGELITDRLVDQRRSHTRVDAA